MQLSDSFFTNLGGSDDEGRGFVFPGHVADSFIIVIFRLTDYAEGSLWKYP
jgi:hypothetical protein